MRRHYTIHADDRPDFDRIRRELRRDGFRFTADRKELSVLIFVTEKELKAIRIWL